MTIGSHDKSQITAHPDGTTVFEGRDATMLYRAMVLAKACEVYAKSGLRLNRAYTPTAMLTAATSVTGQKYRRGQHGKAAADLSLWCDAMKAALPVVEG